MILEQLDRVFDAVREHLSQHVDRCVDARIHDQQLPTYVPFSFIPPTTTRPKNLPTTRRPSRRIGASLSELLDNIAEAFDSARIPSERMRHLPKELAQGLRAMGPWVPFGSPWATGADWVGGEGLRDHVNSETLAHLPAIFYLSRGAKNKLFDGFDVLPTEEPDPTGERLPTGEFGVVAFACGQKCDHAPWYVEQIPGACYSFYVAYRHKKKLFWTGSQMVVDETTGNVKVARELHTQMVALPKGERYPKKIWYSEMVDDDTLWGKLREVRERVCVSMFIAVLEWWTRRRDRWVVSVKHHGERATFSVEQHLTKDFFKDRERTALAADGKIKRIIHFVNAHTRILESGKEVQVREHIRGMRIFNWRGYACAVTAPRFHKWTIHDFTLAGINESEQLPGIKYLGPEKIGKWLATMEDTQVPIRAATIE